jgi:hypothetical protein
MEYRDRSNVVLLLAWGHELVHGGHSDENIAACRNQHGQVLASAKRFPLGGSQVPGILCCGWRCRCDSLFRHPPSCKSQSHPLTQEGIRNLPLSFFILGIRDPLDAGTIFAVGPNTLFNILHPTGHHVLLSRESPHRHIRRSQSDRLNVLNFGTKVYTNALGLGTKVGTNVLDLLLELLRNIRSSASSLSRSSNSGTCKNTCNYGIAK